jgi:CheY-like chemotaxis protein/two-component sensor histidine kinase
LRSAELVKPGAAGVATQPEQVPEFHGADQCNQEFFATLSHELRSPLAPIRTALELLDRDSIDHATRSTATDIIRRQVAQLSRLVEDLLDVSRISRGKIELRREDTELAAVIQSAIETSRPAIDGARHHLKVTLPEQPLYLQADPVRLAQVFSNLLNNAAKFTPNGGSIQIEAQRHGRDVEVRVRDNGIGIARHDLANGFDMFRQSDKSLERAQGGLGIGLTLVRRLVEMHSGSVKAKSEGEGMGSEFTVRLPLAERTSRAMKSPTANEHAPISKRRILVVDDNKDSGDTLALLLKLKGHEVYTARDGFEAIDMANEFRPEVILMDVGMPKLNGYDATRRIRETEHGRNALIVALTGWGQPSDVARSLESGCSAHLVKPVDHTALDHLLASPPERN